MQQETGHHNTVTIPRSEYDNLLNRDMWLSCLETAGVDNWCGLDEAIDIKRAMLDGDD